MGKADSGLTDREELFCHEFLIDLNASKAAARAGYSETYSRQQGHRLMAKRKIADRVAALQAERLARVDQTADSVLQRLTREANADISELYDDDMRLKPVHEWPPLWRRGLVAEVTTEELFQGRGEDRELIGYTKRVRLADRHAKVISIGKHRDIGAFSDKRRGEDQATESPAEEFMRMFGNSGGIRPAAAGEKA